MPDKYEIHTLVWAKMKGFPPWPGRVSDPPAQLKKGSKTKGQQCIYFFGTDNFAMVDVNQIKPYEAFKDEFSKSGKNGLKEAIAAIEEYIKKKASGEIVEAATNSAEAEFDRVRDSSMDESISTPKTPKPKKERKRKTNSTETPIPVKMRASNDAQSSDGIDSYVRKTLIKKSAASHLVDRPAASPVPNNDVLDVSTVSQTLKEKNIKASTQTFGFLGLGNMGSGIVKNMLNSGHKVIIWNRTPAKCEKFEEIGAESVMTPCDVVEQADITFACVSGPEACKELMLGNCGVIGAIRSGKCYVEMTGIDEKTSIDNQDVIVSRGGRYLEAQIQGSRQKAEDGALTLVAAGDRNLFDQCQSVFEAISNHSFFLGEAGNGTKMNLILNTISGVTMAALAEAFALAERAGIQQTDVLEVFALTDQASKLLVNKAKIIIDGGYHTSQALSLMQKDLRLALALGDEKELPLPLVATTNEIYKHAKRLGYGDHDVAAIYIRARF